MVELGKKIAYHRRRLGMTQTELGEQLNVTAQAVSKWENGLSDPDLGSIQRLSKIFGVSTDELIAERETAAETAAAEAAPAEEKPQETSPAPAQESAPADAAPVQPKIVIGYCHDCKRPIMGNEKYHLHAGGKGRSDYIVCKKCEKERQIASKASELQGERRSLRRSMIWGPIAGVAVAAAFLIAAIVTGNYALLGGLAAAVGAFALVSQLFWGEWLFDFLEFFMHAFHMPGLIFSLDLDGIIWFITVKLTLSILSGLLSVFIFLFGLALAMVVGIFTYPFALAVKLHKIEKLDAQYKAMTK